MTYFIADLHLCHRGIIDYDGRPFQTVEEMNETIISRWNSRVHRSDHIYVLGDFIKGDSEQWTLYLDRLNGHKTLIRGNHDPQQLTSEIIGRFDEVADLKEISVDGYRVILCHYPIFLHRGDYKEDVWKLYGHIHNGRENELANQFREQLILNYKDVPDPRGQFINVGCMMPYVDYMPRTINELIEAWRKF